MTFNAICVKWGDKYPAAEVNTLFRGIKRQTQADVRTFCLTDDPAGLDPSIEVLPLREDALQRQLAEAQVRLKRNAGALRKISVFDPDLIPDLDGGLLCFDIDIVATGPLDALFGHAPDKISMPPPFKAKSHIETKGEGSVIGFDPRRHGFLYETMATRTDEMLEFSMGSEQRYTSFTAADHDALAHFPPEWVVSFTRHCRPKKPLNLFIAPRLPDDARIVCFPSRPKADEAVTGYRDGLKTTRPAPWIADYL